MAKKKQLQLEWTITEAEALRFDLLAAEHRVAMLRHDQAGAAIKLAAWEAQENKRRLEAEQAKRAGLVKIAAARYEAHVKKLATQCKIPRDQLWIDTEARIVRKGK